MVHKAAHAAVPALPNVNATKAAAQKAAAIKTNARMKNANRKIAMPVNKA
jgi:hypothetical protein